MAGLHREAMMIAVLGLLTALAAIAVDISLPATPLIAGDLQSSLGAAQLVVTVFLVGLSLGQIPVGLASDHFGRKPVALYGVIIFALASAACALSQELNQLLLARFIQGFASAVGPVVSRAVVRDTVSGEKAARMMAMLVAILTIAPLLAPPVGSLVIALTGWRSVFWGTMLFGALVLFLVSRKLPETAPAIRQHRNPLSQFRKQTALFFSIRQCWAGVLLVALSAGAYLAVITSASTIMADLYGISAAAFGPLFSVAAFAFMVGAMIARRLVSRLGMLGMINLGGSVFLLVITAFVLLMSLGEPSVVAFWAVVSLYMLGHGMILPIATALALDPVPDIAGYAVAIIGTVQVAFGAGMSFLVATFYNHSLIPLVMVMIFCGMATILTRWLAFRNLDSQSSPE